MLRADYGGTYGILPPGNSAVVRFRVQINPAVTIGTTITNTGVVSWNNPAQTDSASVSVDVGGTPGSAALNGSVWHDANLDRIYDSSEQRLQGWSVALYRNSQLVTTVTTDASGVYRLSGLLPNQGTADLFELRFSARGAGFSAAALGDTDSVFTNGPHRISDIIVASGGQSAGFEPAHPAQWHGVRLGCTRTHPRCQALDAQRGYRNACVGPVLQ
jgi:hypothetical protein